MRRILENKLLSIVIALSIVFIVFIGLTASRRDRVSIFEGVIGNVMSPVQKYLYQGGQSVSEFFSFIGNISSIKSENEELKNKNTELENKLADYDSTKAENENLKDMLDFEQQNKQYNYKYVGASVIGKGSGSWSDLYIIDKGSNQGIKKYYPVVAGKGLVGQVMEVGPNWAKVLAIIDEQSRVSGTVSRTQDQGIIQGTLGSSGKRECRMMYLPADSAVQSGDMVVTSNISKSFPKNVIIGEVTGIGDDSSGFVKTVTVKPSVDFDRLRSVFVITNAIDESYYPSEGK